MNPWRRLAEVIAREGLAALVTVHEARGSAPREAGARMVVRPDGAFHGTIGGGRLEWEALAEAAAALREGRGPAREVSRALGPDLGQCCGGWVRLLVETFDRGDLGEVEALAAGEGEAECRWEEGRVRRMVRVPPPAQGEGGPRVSEGRERVRADASTSPEAPRQAGISPRTHPLQTPPDGGAALSLSGRGERPWREPLAPRPTPVALFGAGHVGRALALALAPLPFALRWIDTRADAFPPHVPANAVPILAQNPEAEVAALPDDALVLVLTHDHALDLAIAGAALRRGFPFVGLIGSDTKRARFERRFRELGIPEERIRALACPIGVPGIAGKEPPVIAAGVAAQLLQAREGVS